MTKIDRYILGKFLYNFLLWAFCLAGIVVVFDLFTNMEAVIAAGRDAGNLPKTIAVYYFFRVVPMSNIGSSLLGLVAAMVTVAMMMRNNELVPLQAAGVSQLRIIRPLIFAMIVVTLLSTGLREMLLPRYIHKITDDPSDYVDDQGEIMNATIDNVTGITFNGSRIYRSSHRIVQPTVIVHPPIMAKTVYLKGKEAQYVPAQNGRSAGFIIRGVADFKEILPEKSIMHDGKVVLVPPGDAPDWLAADECFVATDIPFMYLAANRAWGQYASTWEFFTVARNACISSTEQLYGRIHVRLVTPILDMTLLFLGLPVVLVQGDKNVFKAMGMSSLLVMFFLIMKYSCEFIGESNDMPVLGAWLPLMIFVPIAANFYYGMTR